MIFCFLGGGVALVAFFREQRWWEISRHARELAVATREKQEADLRLMVLQAQVEPHFLFNTLASVHSLIRQDPTRAEATLEALVGSPARYAAETANGRWQHAFDAGRTAGDLSQLSHGDEGAHGPRFTFVIDVDPALQRHPFPPLLLISLVENAIKHGIERTTGNGQIMVNAAIESLTRRGSWR